MADQDIVCFRCSQPIGDPPRIHMLGGRPCSACAERLLETLPGVFHTPYTAEEPEQQPTRMETPAGYDETGFESV